MTDYHYEIIFKLARILSLTMDNRSSSLELERLAHDLSRFTASGSFINNAGFAASTKVFVPKPSNIHIPSRVCYVGNIRFVEEVFTPQAAFADGMDWGLQLYMCSDDSKLCSLRFGSEDHRDSFFDLLLCSLVRMR